MKSGKASALRIVVAGYIVGGPLGGLVWHHFQYILGLLCGARLNESNGLHGL